MQTSTGTERLSLNIITPADHDFIQQLVNTQGWLQFIGDRNVHSKEAAIAYIEKIINTPQLTYWVVREKNSDTPLGIISFLKRIYLEHFDIGFAFLPEFAGNGYAYEAAAAVLDNVKKEFDPILATTIPSNEKSIGLLRKLGFRFEKEIEMDGHPLHVYTNATT
jgi:ribosomal-protein-alanine N-acetyltransferase